MVANLRKRLSTLSSVNTIRCLEGEGEGAMIEVYHMDLSIQSTSIRRGGSSRSREQDAFTEKSVPNLISVSNHLLLMRRNSHIGSAVLPGKNLTNKEIEPLTDQFS